MVTILKRNRNRALLLLLSFLLLFSLAASNGSANLGRVKSLAVAVLCDITEDASLFSTTVPASQRTESVLKAGGPLDSVPVVSRQETASTLKTVRGRMPYPDLTAAGTALLFCGSLCTAVFSLFLERHKAEYHYQRLKSGRYPPCSRNF